MTKKKLIVIVLQMGKQDQGIWFFASDKVEFIGWFGKMFSSILMGMRAEMGK